MFEMPTLHSIEWILHNLLTQSPINGHFTPSLVFAFSNNAIVNILAHTFLDTHAYVSVGSISGIGIAGPKAMCIINFDRHCQGPSCRGQS